MPAYLNMLTSTSDVMTELVSYGYFTNRPT